MPPKTVGVILILVVVGVVFSGCVFPARELTATREATREAGSATVEAAAKLSARSTEEVIQGTNRKATIVASGNFWELIVGHWTASIPLHDYYYIEFYPDGTYAALVWPVMAPEEHPRRAVRGGEIITGTYEMLSENTLTMSDSLEGAFTYKLEFRADMSGVDLIPEDSNAREASLSSCENDLELKRFAEENNLFEDDETEEQRMYRYAYREADPFCVEGFEHMPPPSVLEATREERP